MINNIEVFSKYDDIVTVKEVMQMLRISKNNVYKLLNDKRIRSVRIGKRFIIPKQSVIEFITNQ